MLITTDVTRLLCFPWQILWHEDTCQTPLMLEAAVSLGQRDASAKL
jgi:hypothetical protein